MKYIFDKIFSDHYKNIENTIISRTGFRGGLSGL
jgi:hypothetical protein